MRIVIDSNLIVERDWHLSGIYAEALLSASRRGRISLVVPEVVVREVVAAHRDRVLEERKKMRAAMVRLERLEGQSHRDTTLTPPERGEYETAFRNRLRLHRVSVVDVSGDTSAILDRALQRRRPFDAKGRDGFRDALVWQSVINGASDAKLTLFASDNTSDFAGDAPEVLHDHLLNDLESLEVSRDAVRLVRSLEAAVNLAIEPADEILEKLRSRLADDEEWCDSLEHEMRSLVDDEGTAIDDLGVAPTIEVSGEPFEGSIIDSELEDLIVSGGPSVSDAYPLADDRFVVQFEIGAEAQYTLEVGTDGFARHPELVPPGTPLSLDERSAYFSGFADVRVLFDARYTPSSDTLSDLVLMGLVES